MLESILPPASLCSGAKKNNIIAAIIPMCRPDMANI